MSDGFIVFRDAENKVGPDTSEIKDGAFAFRAKQGKKMVEIQAYRRKKPPAGGTAAQEAAWAARAWRGASQLYSRAV